ncbi:MAG: OmpH family outer membrane protein [Desulfobacterales bacterium]|nr:OmpH family outer membrane protein [Desulfobacterales bacterium]MDH3826436.1 OmpH family outer membrane protein [Desulfobacterales bacterium]
MLNRKSNIILIVCFFSLLWLGSVNAADVAKIGVANLQRVLETSNQGKSAQEEIKKQKDQMELELKQKGGEIEELRKQLERESMVMSKEKREEKEREIRIKINDFKSLEKRYRAQLQNLEKKLVNALLKEVSSLVEEIGKKEGYLLIINNSGVLYSPNSINITDQLIKQLNARYAKKSGN